MKLLGKVELICTLKSKIEEAEGTSQEKAKKLKKLLKKLTKGSDVSYI